MSQVKQRFQVGDRVRADHGPVVDITDREGVVAGHHDWWVEVRMRRTGIVMPYMEEELTHVGYISSSD
jgi:hypothetical protein